MKTSWCIYSPFKIKNRSWLIQNLISFLLLIILVLSYFFLIPTTFEGLRFHRMTTIHFKSQSISIRTHWNMDHFLNSLSIYSQVPSIAVWEVQNRRSTDQLECSPRKSFPTTKRVKHWYEYSFHLEIYYCFHCVLTFFK